MQPSITLAVHLVLMSLMIVRGMDYATGETLSSARRLTAVENAAPLWVWGLLFTTCAPAGFAGMMFRHTSTLIGAHIVGAALYATIGIGIVSDVLSRVDEQEPRLTLVLLVPVGLGITALVVAIIKRGTSRTVAITALAALVLGTVSIPLDGFRNSTILFGIAALQAAMAMGLSQVRIRNEQLRQVE